MDRDRDETKAELLALFERASRPRDSAGKIGISGNVVIGDGSRVSQVNVYPPRRRAKRPVPANEQLHRDVLELVVARAEELGLVDEQVRHIAGKVLQRSITQLDLLGSRTSRASTPN